MKTIAETRNGIRKQSDDWLSSETKIVKSKLRKNKAIRRKASILLYPDTYQLISLKVQKAFHQLRGIGYECYADFLCCQTCALSSISSDKYVFWHAQDTDYAHMEGSLSLAWGGEPDDIIKDLRAAGLVVEWDGDHGHRMVVRLSQGGQEVAS